VASPLIRPARFAAVIAALLAAHAPSGAAAGTPGASGSDDGRAHLEAPLGLRGQFPLGLPFIDLMPRSAFLEERRTWRLHLDLSYVSTHATSDAMLELYADATTRPPDGRVTEAILTDTAATDPSGHAYYVDGETARMTVDFTWGLSRRVELNATLPLLTHSGGFLDPTINEFHDFLHLPDGGRPDFAVDQYVVGLTDDGETVFLGGAPGGIGLGDLLLEARVALARPPGDRFALAATGSIELPTGDADRLDGNGAVDFAGGLEATWRVKRSTWHAGGAYAIPGRFDPAPGLAPRNRIAAYASTAILVGERRSFVIALHGVTGPFGRESGGSLGGTSLETSFAYRQRTSSGGVFEAALLENLTASHNVPDVGIYLGWGFAPRH